MCFLRYGHRKLLGLLGNLKAWLRGASCSWCSAPWSLPVRWAGGSREQFSPGEPMASRQLLPGDISYSEKSDPLAPLQASTYYPPQLSYLAPKHPLLDPPPYRLAKRVQWSPTVPSFTVPALTVPAFTVPSFMVPACTVPSFTLLSFTVPAFTVQSFPVPVFTVQSFPVPVFTVHAFTVRSFTVI